MKKYILILILIANYFVGWAIEPDPRILWVSDSSIVKIDGFAVHPNGNVFAYRGSKIYEIDGTNGKLIRELPKFTESDEIASIDISNDGKYLAISLNEVIVIDLTDLSSKTIGHGNPVKFTSDSKYAVFGPQNPAQHYQGHDSTLVFVNIENGERKFLKNEEGIVSFAFSPDGRYFATGGIGKNIYDKYYMTFKLWDAQSLKLIKELGRLNTNVQTRTIQFTQDSKLVAFLPYSGEVSIYDTETTTLFRKYDQYNYPFTGIGQFTFINDTFIVFSTQTPSTFIWNFKKDENAFNLTNYKSTRGIKFSNKLDIIILATETQLIAFDMKKILSNVTENPIDLELKSEYQKGILSITGIELINNSVNLEIFDINGKLVRQLNVEPNGTELRIPIVLTKGTYLLNLTDGSKKYSSKFLVIE